VTVEEAAVHKDHGTVFPQDQIGATWQFLIVQPVTQSKSKEASPKGKLRASYSRP
jgi:hypothetical protein